MAKRGRKPIAPATPEELDNMFEAYKKKCLDDTRVDIRTGAVVHKPFTWVGFMAFLGVGYKPADFISYYKAKKEFCDLITRIGNEIEADQLNGAMMGDYNANLVARLNGYTEKTENKHEVKGGFVWKEIE